MKYPKPQSAAHPGFNSVANKIAKTFTPRSGETPKEAAAAILASSSRNASAKAKSNNPRLSRVKGK